MPVSPFRDQVCHAARELAHRYQSLTALAAAVSERVGVEMTKSALRHAYRRWREESGAPALLDILGKGPDSDFTDEPTNPGTATGGDPDAATLQSCLQWGSLLERQSVEALARYGSMAEAAEAMGMPVLLLRGIFDDLQRKAAARGWSPRNNMTKTVPDGFHVKGVSTYYDADGQVQGQWVKSSRDQENQIAALVEAMQIASQPFTGLADPAPAPSFKNSDLLAIYPMGDPHLGMRAWAAECGQSFDLNIAERNLVAAIDHLVELAPAAEEALIISLGDTTHADNGRSTTTAGTFVDTDTRWPKVLSVTVRTLRRCIDRALLKHAKVRVVIARGNHDDLTSFALALCLANFYEREPRVEIDTSPDKFHWHRFGKNLLGIVHGDTTKARDLPGIMACDRKQDWGETEHRYFYCGHIHHETVKEYPGVVVETFRTLAPRDAWHSAAGYRSGQDMRLHVLHREHGRILQHSVGIQQLTGGRS